MTAFKLPSLLPPSAANAADRRLRLVAARGGAELASMGAAIGAVYCAQKITPQNLAAFQEFFARRVVAPNLERFDWLADKMPGFEGKDGVALRHSMSPEDKARYFAEGFVNYSLMGGGAIVGQTAVQWLLDHVLGLHLKGTAWENTKKMALATTADRGIQLASMGLLTGGAPQLSEDLQEKIATHVIGKLGIKNETVARENARYFVTWQIPNLMGWAGSLGILDNVYKQELRRGAPGA